MSGFGVNGWQTPSTFAANRFQAHLAGDVTGSDQFNLAPAIGQHENELRQLSGGWVSQVQGIGGVKGDEGSATHAGTSGQPYKVTEADGAAISVPIIPHTRAIQGIKDGVENVRDNGVNAETVGSAALGVLGGKRVLKAVPDNATQKSDATAQDMREKRVEQLNKNKAAGKAFEAKALEQIKTEQSDVVEQVTIKTKSGVKTRVDIIGKDDKGDIACTECKASPTATLTPNQKRAFPEIEESGGEIVGKGKPGFPGGTEIPPTKVNILRGEKKDD